MNVRRMAFGLCFVLTGCIGQDMADLHSYVEEVKSRGEAPIEPVPEIRQPETYVYRSSELGLRDPFTPEVEEETPVAAAPGGVAPDDLRPKEELEAFSLDTLRMVGTLQREEARWALVQNKQGVIYRVKPGNFMGQNHGRITGVFEDRVELVEIVPDRAGGYVEQSATLAIGE